jgi:hypothetical protein
MPRHIKTAALGGQQGVASVDAIATVSTASQQ